MGLIMNLDPEKVEIWRISLESNKLYKEPWIIDIPVQISTFRYNTEERKAKSVAPKFEGENEIKLIKNQVGEEIFNQINFKQATHPDFVHSYRIVLDNGNMAGVGTHKQLLKKCKVYKEIALSQLSKEELENE